MKGIEIKVNFIALFDFFAHNNIATNDFIFERWIISRIAIFVNLIAIVAQ